MADNLTLMAVHAHPDDEASSTGGVLARYSAEGVRTIVVTCTNGEFGDAPGGIKPGADGHDEQEVAEIRLAELRESAKHLGVTDLELLGYHDSGMVEWEYKDRPDAFCNVPLDDVAARIGMAGRRALVVPADLSELENVARLAEAFVWCCARSGLWSFSPLEVAVFDWAMEWAADAVYAAVAKRFGATLITLDREQRRRAATYVAALFIEPADEDVHWLSEHGTDCDVDHAARDHSGSDRAEEHSREGC